MGNTLVEKINVDLKQIDERLSVDYGTEDIYGQDFEEYGIEDIEETLHYSLLFRTSESSATVIKEHFEFSQPRSLQLGRNAENNLLYKGFTAKQNCEIEQVLMSHKI